MGKLPALKAGLGFCYALLLLWGSSAFLCAETTRVQLADGFDHPLGDPAGSGEGYYAFRGWSENHPATDFARVNASEEGAALSEPVFAIGRGVVLLAEDFEETMGETVIIRHAFRDPETTRIELVDSVYSQLDEISVQQGELVERNQQIAILGDHLHFELRHSQGLQIGSHVNDFPRDGKHYLNPEDFLVKFKNLEKENTYARFRLDFENNGSTSSMSVGDALILGVVEGLTEYLPVSSTGHLLVTQDLLGIVPRRDEVSVEEFEKQETAANAFAIAIQGGAILAVLGIYWGRCRQMLFALVGKDVPGQVDTVAEGRRLIVAMIAAFLPAAVIGLIFNDKIKHYLFGIQPTVAAWIVGGVGILWLSRWLKKRHGGDPEKGIQLGEITWKIALGIGFFQCVAMWPGTSRSLMTIAGALLLGMSLSAAVEFAFLLGVVTLGAATVYDTLKHGELMLETYSWPALIAGFVAAAISAAVAVKWMVAYLKKHDLAIFGWYRLAIGLVGLACILLLNWGL